MFFQILLMILLGWIKNGSLSDLSDNLFFVFPWLFKVVFWLFRDTLLFCGMIENCGSVLCPNIGSLSVLCCRVVNVPEYLQKLFVGYFLWIVSDFDSLCMSSFIGADIFIGRVLQHTPSISYRRRNNTTEVSKRFFDMPKTSSSKGRFLHSNHLSETIRFRWLLIVFHLIKRRYYYLRIKKVWLLKWR